MVFNLFIEILHMFLKHSAVAVILEPVSLSALIFIVVFCFFHSLIYSLLCLAGTQE